jgi:uncharacterized protein (TIGR01244 family)
MWPFSSNASRDANYRQVDSDFAVAAQISIADLPKIAEAGFKTVLCARPDHEEPGQPDFSIIARAAKAAGLEAVHIPVSGMVGEGQLIRMESALRDLPKPMLAYCRSGARAGSLYASTKRAAR